MTAPQRKPVETATSRVQRLLTMVPWLVSRQGIELGDAACGLGISEAQLREDLDLLFMCGYGTMPDELVDVSYEAGRVFIGNVDTIARPLRLGVDEAVSLIVGLRALQASGAAASEAIERALVKLEGATGQISGVERVQVAADESVDPTIMDLIRDALTRRHRLHLAYLVPSRDERTERDVDPYRLVRYDGRWYLEGFCHRAQDMRLFRVDRVEQVHVLDEPIAGREGYVPRDLDAGLYPMADDDPVAVVDLAPGAHWVADYYPVASREDRGGGVLRVGLPGRDEEFVIRLLLRLGASATVVAPDSLKGSLLQRVEAARAGYLGG